MVFTQTPERGWGGSRANWLDYWFYELDNEFGSAATGTVIEFTVEMAQVF
jgi:hypothetical protein